MAALCSLWLIVWVAWRSCRAWRTAPKQPRVVFCPADDQVQTAAPLDATAKAKYHFVQATKARLLAAPLVSAPPGGSIVTGPFRGSFGPMRGDRVFGPPMPGPLTYV